MTRRKISSRACRGLIITDVVIGLMILSSLLAITAITVGHDQRNTREAVAHRQLTDAAETALIALQNNGQPQPLADPAITMAFTQLSADAPDGTKWVAVQVSKGKVSTEVIGLVPSHVLTDAPVAEPVIDSGGQP